MTKTENSKNLERYKLTLIILMFYYTAFNKLTKENFAEKLKQAFFARGENVLSGKVKLILTKRSTKDLINGYIIFNRGKHFLKHRSKYCLVFQPISKYSQKFTGTDKIFAWKPK